MLSSILDTGRKTQVTKTVTLQLFQIFSERVPLRETKAPSYISMIGGSRISIVQI